MFGWLRNRRRRRWLAEPFPAVWDEILQQHIKQTSHLPPELATKWRQRIQVFVAATTWEGCRDFAITAEVRVIIAGYATLLVLGLSVVGTGAVLLSRLGSRPRDSYARGRNCCDPSQQGGAGRPLFKH